MVKALKWHLWYVYMALYPGCFHGVIGVGKRDLPRCMSHLR